MTKYAVFYLFDMTSNVSSFVCLAYVLIISHLPVPTCFVSTFQSCRAAFFVQHVVPRVSLCSVSLLVQDFPVWHGFDGGRVLAFPKIVWQPRLDHARYSSVWSLSQQRGMQAFLAIQTTPLPPPKKRLTDYFQSAKGMSRRGMPYFLQKYNPRLVAAAFRSSFDDCTAGELSSLNDPASLVPVLVILSQKARHTQYCEQNVLSCPEIGCFEIRWDTLEIRGCTPFRYPCTTIQGWKGLDQQPRDKKISQARKGKNKAGAGCPPLLYSEDLDMELCQWVFEKWDLHLPIQRKHIQRKAIALIQTTHPTFKASVGWLSKFWRGSP